MPLSNKLIADYIELINEKLDLIQMENLQDFVHVQRMLFNIIGLNIFIIPDKFHNTMSSINDIYTQPEEWVQNQADYQQFKSIIKERIDSKITELQSMNEQQRLALIQAQQNARLEVARNHQIMAQHRLPQPGDEGYLPDLSERDFLLRRQAEFNAEPVPAPQARNQRGAAQFFVPLEVPLWATAQSETTGIPIPQILHYHRNEPDNYDRIAILTTYLQNYRDGLQPALSLEEVLNTTQQEYLNLSTGFHWLVGGLLNFAEVRSLTEDERMILYNGMINNPGTELERRITGVQQVHAHRQSQLQQPAFGMN